MKEVKTFFNKEWEKSDKAVWSLLALAVGIIIGMIIAPRKGNVKIGSDNRHNGNGNSPTTTNTSEKKPKQARK